MFGGGVGIALAGIVACGVIVIGLLLDGWRGGGRIIGAVRGRWR